MTLKFFHIYDRGIRGIINKFIISNREKDELGDLWGIIKEMLLIKLWIVMVGLFLLVFFLVPYLNSWIGLQTHVDTTIWIGTLSFEGAFALGIIAVTPWLSKVTVRILPAFLDSAIEHGLVNRPQGVSDNWKLIDEVEEMIKNNSPEIERYGVQLSVSAIQLICGVIILMPLSMWLSQRVEAGLLLATIVWIFYLFGRVSIIAFLLYNDIIWKIYKFLKKGHQELMKSCKICSESKISE